MGEGLPVARVCVMVPPIHLDRPFEYLVPEDLSGSARAGCRVRVRYGSRIVDGFILSRAATPEHKGRLLAIETVCGPPVLDAEIIRLARSVADRYVGTLPEVLRDAVPRRHVRAERRMAAPAGVDSNGADSVPARVESASSDLFPWQDYGDAGALRARIGLAGADPVRASLTIGTGHDPVAAIGDLVSGAVHAGPCLVVAGGGHMVDRLVDGIRRRVAPARVERLSADMGAEARYAAHLRIMAGEVGVVVGTRSAAFAPIRHVALAVLWDDGDDALAEPHHPGWHAREVMALRARQQDSSLVIAGYARTVTVARMVATGYLTSWQPDRAHAREARPDVLAAETGAGGSGGAGVQRIPALAFTVIRNGLRLGPVLVQVARKGYVPGMACRRCGRRARCGRCGGPLGLEGDRSAGCTWCGLAIDGFRCDACGGTDLRALALGSGRTAEELARAFPMVRVVVSSGDHIVRDRVPDSPLIVVATVGAEPGAARGYASAILLDGDRMLARPDLVAEEETLRRWFSAIALVRSRSLGGVAVVAADPRQRAVQALLRADPVGWSERELDERAQAHLPPAAVVARVVGPPACTSELVEGLGVAGHGTVIGPVPASGGDPGCRSSDGDVGYMVFVPRSRHGELARDLRAGLVTLSAGGRRRLPSVRIDPSSLG